MFDNTIKLNNDYFMKSTSILSAINILDLYLNNEDIEETVLCSSLNIIYNTYYNCDKYYDINKRKFINMNILERYDDGDTNSFDLSKIIIIWTYFWNEILSLDYFNSKSKRKYTKNYFNSPTISSPNFIKEEIKLINEESCIRHDYSGEINIELNFLKNLYLCLQDSQNINILNKSIGIFVYYIHWRNNKQLKENLNKEKKR